MRILVIGAGAREHTLCWALRRSPTVTFIACLPGNGGTAALATNVPGDPRDFAAIVAYARDERIDLVVVGPEEPLSQGLVDELTAAGLRCLGPTRAAARIESSKVWAKAFMERHAIPTAAARLVEAATLAEAVAALHAPEARFPVAIKADGLAAGKGVVIAQDAGEAAAALRAMITAARFGAAGARVLVESFLVGREVSVFALCDGQSYRILGTACDHKRAFDGDTGPNTGGMGAYAPAAWLDAATLARIERDIIAPTVGGMAAEGCPFTGFLFAGLMITTAGPQVIEFNARFGDPEAQVVLPLIDSPLADLFLAAASGQLALTEPIRARPGAACGVVITAGEYPERGVRDAAITGLDAVDSAALIFHGGTRRDASGTILADGGRILTVVGLGADLPAARALAYANAARVTFSGARYRRDIGQRA